MNKNVLIFIMIFLLLFSCNGILTDKYYKKSFEKHTNIKFPKSSKKIEIYDYYYINIGKYLIIDKNEIKKYITEYNFKKLDINNKSLIKSDNYLKKENKVIFNENEFYFKSGKTKSYKWNILINKTTGELWIEILYPGYSGYN